MSRTRLARPLLLSLCGALTIVSLACAKPDQVEPKASPSVTITPRPKSTPTPISQGLRQQAEQTLLPKMSVGLADLVRKQAWFQELTPSGMSLLTMLGKCDQAARQHGEPAATQGALQYASEQGWYTDGLDDRERKGLSEVFNAFALSYTKADAPPVGTVLSTTLRFQSFDVVNLPETGEKVVIVASKDQKLGQKALELATTFLPQIEQFAGKFPYPFIYIEISPDFPEEVYGLSYDEFIALNPKAVDANTLAHELTHSTLYGIFPIWFEEGLAYFLGAQLSGELEADSRQAVTDLAKIKATNKVDIINYRVYTDWDYFAETRRGFLFVKSLVDIEGLDGMSRTVKALRSKSYGDNELLAAILQNAATELQTQLHKLFCERIVGGTRNYCIPGA